MKEYLSGGIWLLVRGHVTAICNLGGFFLLEWSISGSFPFVILKSLVPVRPQIKVRKTNVLKKQQRKSSSAYFVRLELKT